MQTSILFQSGDVVVDPTEVPTVEEVFSLRSRLQSMEAMQQEMNNEMLRMQEERTLLLAQIEQLKDLQVPTFLWKDFLNYSFDFDVFSFVSSTTRITRPLITCIFARA